MSSIWDSPAKRLKAGADVLGNEIKPGDWIVYGAAKGRCAGINVGRVLDVMGRKFRVAAVDVSYGAYRRIQRPSTLQFSDRICVVPETSVSETIKALLA